MSNGNEPKPNLIAVFFTVLILLAFVVFVLVYDDLRTNQAALLFAGAMISAIVSVILFSVVPSNANPYLRTGVSLGGAALFFYMVYPPLRDDISHPDLTISGGVYYQNDPSSQTFRPVAGVTVTIPYNTDLKSQTDDLGAFAIHHAPPGVKALFAVYKNVIYPIDLTKYTNENYPVIPPETTKIAADILPPPRILNGASVQPIEQQQIDSSSWVYLGDHKDGKWLIKNFDLSGQPQAKDSLHAMTPVYKRDDKPVQVGGDWKLGNVQGVLDTGNSVKVKNVLAIAGDAGTAHWWAQVCDPGKGCA